MTEEYFEIDCLCACGCSEDASRIYKGIPLSANHILRHYQRYLQRQEALRSERQAGLSLGQHITRQQESADRSDTLLPSWSPADNLEHTITSEEQLKRIRKAGL